MRAVLTFIGVTFMLVLAAGACGPATGASIQRGSQTSPATSPTLTAPQRAATAGLLPEGLVVATRTPDVSLLNKLRPRELLDQLSQDPKLARLFSAIESRNVELLLDEVDWRPLPCGGRLTEPCPDGIAPGTALGTVSVGNESSVTRDEAATPLGALLESLAEVPAFVAESQSEPAHYVIGYYATGDVAMNFPSAFGDPSETIGGVLFDVDTRAAYSVQSLELTPRYPATLTYGVQRVRDSRGDLLMLLVTQY